MGIWCFFTFNVNPVIRTVSEEEMRALAVHAVNNAAEETMASNPSYTQLVNIDRTADGKITSIQANAVLINALARQTTLKAQEYISQMGEQGISIPLGSFSGINFLAGRGPDVVIKVLPVGSIETSFYSEFTSAGINQTKHQMFLDVSASVSIVIPGLNNGIKVATAVLISEALIVGEIPDVYLQSGKTGSLLDLIP